MTRGVELHRPVVAALVATAALVLSLMQGAAAQGWSSFVSQTVFDQKIFPGHIAFYTYGALKSASGSPFTKFGTSGTSDDQRRELAAFFANVKQESGGLTLQYEQGCDTACKQSYCSSSATYPCSHTQPPYYFGRGPIQLSWNYNYGACGKYLNIALLTDPGLISGSAVTAFRTAFWYWMTQGGHAGVTPHNAILAKSFAGTIRAINGDIECKSGTHYSEAGHQEMLSRVSYYKSFCQVLGVKDIGTDLEC